MSIASSASRTRLSTTIMSASQVTDGRGECEQARLGLDEDVAGDEALSLARIPSVSLAVMPTPSARHMFDLIWTVVQPLNEVLKE